MLFVRWRPCAPHAPNICFLGPPESSTQTSSGSVQPFLKVSLVWQTDRQTDHASRSVTIGSIYVRSTAMRPNSNKWSWFFGPIRVYNPNDISISSAVFAQHNAPIFYPFPPQSCFFAWDDLNPRLTHASWGPPESINQTASRSVQPFCMADVRNRRTDRQTDRQIDHATPSVTIGRIYV